MSMLIIEENMGTKGCKNISFLDAAKKEGFIHTDAPSAERFNRPLMSGNASGSNKRCADWRLLLVLWEEAYLHWRVHAH